MDSPGPALVVQNRGLTMTDSNANNLYLRHGYQAHLREAKGVDPKTIDLVVSAIEDFDISIEHCDYLRLTKAISLEYKTRLSKRASKSSGQPLARGTIVRRLGHIQDYLRWVKTRKGFVGLDQDVIDFLTPSRRLRTSLTTTTELAGPLPAVLEALIRGMPSDTFLERRNRAAIALIYLTGVRDGVIPTLSLRHIDVSSGALEQDGLEVATKFGKTMRTFFFPIPEDIRTVVVDWVRELEALRWDPDWPLLPAAAGAAVSARLQSASPKRFKTVQWVRDFLHAECLKANLEPFYPHKIRKTLVYLGDDKCHTRRDIRAWSQNLGHERVETTDSSYGKLDPSEVQHRLMQPPKENFDDVVDKLRGLSAKKFNAVVGVIEQMAGIKSV